MHITTISRPDLAYATMRLSGYMSRPNLPIFEALHHTMCYLYHHPHLPIMYPENQLNLMTTPSPPFGPKDMPNT
jgi:hypothetical protein